MYNKSLEILIIKIITSCFDIEEQKILVTLEVVKNNKGFVLRKKFSFFDYALFYENGNVFIKVFKEKKKYDEAFYSRSNYFNLAFEPAQFLTIGKFFNELIYNYRAELDKLILWP
jgi:hypothetical protein